jgi:hypothetical protein
MGIDNKYGHVTTEHGTIGDTEPVVVFRAQDRLLGRVLDFYRTLCREAGSPQHHLNLIAETHRQVDDWQRTHPTQTPNSNDHAARKDTT